MIIPAFAISDLYSIIIIGILLRAIKQTKNEYILQKKYLMTIMFNVSILILCDIVMRIPYIDNDFYLAHLFADSWSFCINPVICLITMYYVDTWMGHRETGSFKKWALIPKMLVIVNFIVYIMSILFNQQWFYQYVFNGKRWICIEQPGLIFNTVVIVAIYCNTFLYVIIKRKNMAKHYRFSLILFQIIPMVSCAMQAFTRSFTTSYPGIIISFLFITYYSALRDAEEDGLTKVCTRKRIDVVYEDHINRVLHGGRSFAAIMVDVDNFKIINDTYGHEVGDHVLVNIASYLANAFSYRTIIGRFGGDEFFIILDVDNEEVLEKEIVKMQKRFGKVNSFRNIGFKVTISIGYGIYNKLFTKTEFKTMIDGRMYDEKAKHHKNEAGN